MLSLTHTLISLPFALYFNNPVLIFLAAFVFHLFADTLLHWNIYTDDFKKYPILLVAGDVIGGLVISYLFVGNQVLTIPFLAAIAGGNMPDILHSFWDLTSQPVKNRYFSWAKPFFSFHNDLQLETKKIGLGLVSQIILVALAIAAIARAM